MKTIKRITLVIVFLILAAVIVAQYKVEQYIATQRTKYGILPTEKRLKYTPYAYFHLFLRNPIDGLSRVLPYTSVGLSEAIGIMYFDEYIVYCYYAKKDKLLYVHKKYSPDTMARIFKGYKVEDYPD